MDKKSEQKDPVSKDYSSDDDEIVEDIFVAEDSDSEGEIPLFLNEDDSLVANKRRQLFGIEGDDEGGRFFLDNDDEDSINDVLSGDNIAKHFQGSDTHEKFVPLTSDSKSPKKSASQFKELSPMNEDTILINNQKVSINALKRVQSNSSVPHSSDHDEEPNGKKFLFSSLSYESSKPAVIDEGSRSLDFEPVVDSESPNDSVEHENSVDEIVISEKYDISGSNTDSGDFREQVNIKSANPIPEKEKPTFEEPTTVKKMEKMDEFQKEMLDDITEEESDREFEKSQEQNRLIEKGGTIRKILEEQLNIGASTSKAIFDSVNSDSGNAGRIKTLEQRVRDLEEILTDKEACLTSMNLQLGLVSKRDNFKESNSRDSLREAGRDASSIGTSVSTEYRTINDEVNFRILDIENELQERDKYIEELNGKLQKSAEEREELQLQGDKIALECMELKKLIDIRSDTLNALPDIEIPLEMTDFQKLLNPDELRIFSMVWSKFDEFHKNVKPENDNKNSEQELIGLKKLLTSVQDGATEVAELRKELEAKHAKEMEELREYFEKRCVDMEKQYSEDVFSQHSRKASEDLNSDASDQENLPEDFKESPRRVQREISLKSPKKIVSEKLDSSVLSTVIENDLKNSQQSPEEIRQFYTEKISEMSKEYDLTLRSLKTKLKWFEDKYTDNEFVQSDEPTELNDIIIEYDRRLQEQVALAREDVLHELEIQIQALLSENSREDSHWPPELILLREKFTAKSQLEIAQLRIKHDEEMARMKTDYEKQLQRKQKRHAAFDSVRDFDKIITERDNLRELSSSLRFALSELAKYFSICEDEINSTLLEELNKCDVSFSNDESNLSVLSSGSNQPKRLVTFKPDISSLIAIINDPSLMEFVSKHEDTLNSSFQQINIDECLNRLKGEAMNILSLSEELYKKNHQELEQDKSSEKTDSCEEEDGLKRSPLKVQSKSLENFSPNGEQLANGVMVPHSLPIFQENSQLQSELVQELCNLKNELIKSEEERKQLEQTLANVSRKSDGLVQELSDTKNQLQSLSDLNTSKEIFTEGFGTHNISAQQNNVSLMELQEKAKTFLTATPNNSVLDSSVQLYQLIEDYCRETDNYMETDKKNREDLQAQVEAADNKLKATRKFLEDQAAEREQERDEFSKEIEKLKIVIKDKEKDKSSQEHIHKEMEILEQQIKELTAEIKHHEEQKAQSEEDLKASVDKVFVLREIISDLEGQIQLKNLNEHVNEERSQELQHYIDSQNQSIEVLKTEMENLKSDLEGNGYTERISYLEEQLKQARPNAEQTLLIEQMTSQLKTIEMTIDRKTKTLESFHALSSTCSTTCSSPSEDVSVRGGGDFEDRSPFKSPKFSTGGCLLPFDEVHRILDKVAKHNRVEEATVKRVTDLEMQMHQFKNSYNELQQEKDSLQDRMSEQLIKISSLQSRLDEQRMRAEELHRQGTSDMAIKCHDLQNELTTAKDTLNARDKQIANLNQLLENSKKIIDRQEAEWTITSQNDDKSFMDRLEANLKQKTEENQRLKEKIKTEMINKIALPDLMDTIIAEKNDEIEDLKEKLEKFTKNFDRMEKTENSMTRKENSVLSMVSEYDEPDVVRKMVDSSDLRQLCRNPLMETSLKMSSDSFGCSSSNLPGTTASSAHNALQFSGLPSYIHTTTSKEDSSMSQQLVPRQIHFSSDNEIFSSAEIARLKTELEEITKEKNLLIESLKEDLKIKIDEMAGIQIELSAKIKLYVDLLEDKRGVERELSEAKVRVAQLLSAESNLKKKEDEIQNYMQKIEELENELSGKGNDMKNLQLIIAEKDEKLENLNREMTRANHQFQSNELGLRDLDQLRSQMQTLTSTLEQKDDTMVRLEKELFKYIANEQELQRQIEELDARGGAEGELENEMDSIKRELSLKSFALEKCKIDLLEFEQQMNLLKGQIKSAEPPMSTSFNKGLTANEMAERLEQELNYSAELDGNIIKAIESGDELHSENDDEQEILQMTKRYDETIRDLEVCREELLKEVNDLKLRLSNEQKNSDSIQNQDASLIEAIKTRLEQALDNENVLRQLLDDERRKTETLSSQLTGIQRTRSFDNYLLFNNRSLPESPSHRRLAKLNELESEVITRLQSEIKLLTSQNERERDRVVDLQKVLDREKERFIRAIADQTEYSDQLKKEIKRLEHDKEQIEIEMDEMQQELKMKSFPTDKEKEKEKLLETIRVLRDEVDRGVKRETKLASALLKESSDSGDSDSVPEQFLQKLKEINKSLADNVRENHQMAETLQILTEERRSLQHRIAELENNQGLVHYTSNNHDLEERANHLFAKYLRSESFRKALIYQKRYLLITIASYQPTHVLPIFSSNHNQPKKRKSFRMIAMVVIAVERMKYVVRRWHSGKRVGAKAIFSIPTYLAPRRSQSASTNNWATGIVHRPDNLPLTNNYTQNMQKQFNSPPQREKSFILTQSNKPQMTSFNKIFNANQESKRNKVDILQKLFDNEDSQNNFS